MDNQLFEKELKNFLDNEGRLKGYPSKFKLKITALFYLASKFEFEKQYSEKEINQILKYWHTFEDWAMLRRDLCDRGFLGRASNGSVYWLEDHQPTF